MNTPMPIFPCIKNTKRPATRNGFYAATTDAAQIAKWTKRFPDANWAVATEAAGLVVLDIDAKNGKPGHATLQALEAKHGTLPATHRVDTPNGGFHLYFRMPAGADIRSGNGKLGHGIDVKAGGGYVLLSGTIDGKPYVTHAAPIAELPAWVTHLIL